VGFSLNSTLSLSEGCEAPDRAVSYPGDAPQKHAALVTAQDNKCAICNTSVSGNLHIDHCHNSNKIRGLLCGSCNRGLGLFKDNSAVLASAIKYLEGSLDVNKKTD
jgi:hypothetical protein